MREKILRASKILNIFSYLILVFLGFYSIAFCAYLLESSSAFIFYLPLLIILITEPILSALINAIFISILLLSTFMILKISLQTPNDTYPHVPGYVLMLLSFNVILSLILPPSMPIQPTIELVPAIILWAPIYEEFFFRFLLIVLPIAIISKDPMIVFKGKNAVRRSDFTFIIISSALFGFFHLIYGIGAVLAAMIAGIVMGFIAIRYNILVSINIHFLLNTITASAIVALSWGHVLIMPFILTAILLSVVLGVTTFIITLFLFIDSSIIKKQ